MGLCPAPTRTLKAVALDERTRVGVFENDRIKVNWKAGRGYALATIACADTAPSRGGRFPFSC